MLVQLLQHILEGIHLVLVALERGRKRFFDVRITDVLQDLHSSVWAFLQESLVHRYSPSLVRLVHLLEVWVEDYLEWILRRWLGILIFSCLCNRTFWFSIDIDISDFLLFLRITPFWNLLRLVFRFLRYIFHLIEKLFVKNLTERPPHRLWLRSRWLFRHLPHWIFVRAPNPLQSTSRLVVTILFQHFDIIGQRLQALESPSQQPTASFFLQLFEHQVLLAEWVFLLSIIVSAFIHFSVRF